MVTAMRVLDHIRQTSMLMRKLGFVLNITCGYKCKSCILFVPLFCILFCNGLA